MCFFVFKQKTAYEMRISDWSSDVCSSDPPLKPARYKADLRPVCGKGAHHRPAYSSRSASDDHDRRRLVISLHSSPRAAIVLIRSAVLQAIACMVREGLTPPTVGNTDPSQIHKLGISQLRQSALTTMVRTKERRVGKECGGRCKSGWSPYR